MEHITTTQEDQKVRQSGTKFEHTWSKSRFLANKILVPREQITSTNGTHFEP